MRELLKMIMRETYSQAVVSVLYFDVFPKSEFGPILGSIIAVCAFTWTVVVWVPYMVFRALQYFNNPEKAKAISKKRADDNEWLINTYH